MVGGDLPEYSLAIWHGVNMPLVMSLVALAGGIVLYACCVGNAPKARWTPHR